MIERSRRSGGDDWKTERLVFNYRDTVSGREAEKRPTRARRHRRPNTGGEAKGTGLTQILAIWSRRKWLAIVVFATLFAPVVSVVRVLPDVYPATATVLVERHQVPETFVRSLVIGEVDTRLQTISQEILSRGRLKDLITRFDLYPNLRQRMVLEDVVEKMRRDVQLELKGAEPTAAGRTVTVAFNLSYRGRNPETVAAVTNTLASFYVEENLRLRARQAASTADVLRTQLSDLKARVDAYERRLKDFRNRSIGELPEQTAANMATLSQLNTQLLLNSNNQLRAMGRRTELQKQVAEADPDGAASGPEAAVTRLAKLKHELRELRGRFTNNYPDVIHKEWEVASLEQKLAETVAGTAAVPMNPAISQLRAALLQADAELKALRAEEQELRQQSAAYQRRLESAPQREQELQDLTRDYQTTKDLRDSLLKRYEDAKLAESMEQRQRGEQFRILDPAVPATQPVAPKRVQLVFFGSMLALAVAAGAVMLAERADTSFHSMDSLRTLAKGSVVVSIPLILTKADKRRKTRWFCLAVVAGMLVLALIVDVSQYVATGNEQLVGMLMRGGS
jgi:protein tyrosine kinase modulator